MKRERIVLSVAAAAVLVLSGCSSKSGDDTPSDGTFTIEQTGGNSSAGNGGSYSRNIYISSYGANIRIEKTGTVDTSFTVPVNDHVTNLGNYGAIFTVNMQIPLLSSGTPAADTYFTTVDTPRRIYRSNGDSNLSNDEVVTGIQVNEGVTLTLGLNNDSNNANGNDDAKFNFTDDIIINGTLRTESLDDAGSTDNVNRDKGSLTLINNGAIIVGSSGLIDTSGADATSGQAGDGAAIYLETLAAQPIRVEGRIDASGGDSADTSGSYGGDAAISFNGNWGIRLYSRREGGSFVHTGASTIDNTGGDAYHAGYGGKIHIKTNEDLYSTGKIDASSGDATHYVPSSEDIWLSTDNGSIYNSGDIFSKGGNGTVDGKGGSGGEVHFRMNGNGGQAVNFYNSGDINVNGGDSVAYGGGNAGDIYLSANVYGGNFRNSGNLYANGGSAGSTYNGGSGGFIDLWSNNQDIVSNGDMLITGNIHNNGGIAQDGNGGTSGHTEIILSNVTDETHTFSLLGYKSMNVSGGDGADAGGKGGVIEIYMYDNTASLYNEVDMYGHGGDATSDGKGGDGGRFTISPTNESDVQNSGSLYFNGGSSIGLYDNSNGGTVYIDQNGNADSVSNTADIITVAAGTGGTGGSGSNGEIIIANVPFNPPDGTLP